MRHGDAPGGAGDPPGFDLDDCATQRNLSEAGRVGARAIGAMLRAKGIAVGRLLSSPWCRCLDTATLLDLGPPEIAPAFANAFVLADRQDELAGAARAVLAAWDGPGTLVVIAHGANILPLAGVRPAPGEIVVVTATDDGAIELVGRIPPPS